MNLLIDAHVFDGVHQGSRTYLKGLYSELITLMPETSFFFASYNSANLRKEFGNLSNVRYVQLKRRKIFRLLFEFPVIIRKYKIDFAHFQYISPPYKNCKHIVTTHDILFKDFKSLFPLKYRIINNLMFRISALRADILLTVSEYSRQRISKHYKISETTIFITTNGVSKDFLTEKASIIESNIKLKYNLNRFILYVSRIEPRKNHLSLLRAFSDLKLWERGYTLVFIGKKDFSFKEFDRFLENCQEECKRATLLVQNVEHNELLPFFKEADLFVYPSLAEGFGIPPIEAIASGTPTLCSNATAMSDFAFLGDDLFNPNDIQELKSKILSKFSASKDLNRIAYLKQIVREQYSWEKSAKSFISSITNS